MATAGVRVAKSESDPVWAQCAPKLDQGGTQTGSITYK